MNAKIRNAQLMKAPYMLVAGDEIANETVSLRRRDGERRNGFMPAGEFIAHVQSRIAAFERTVGDDGLAQDIAGFGGARQRQQGATGSYRRALSIARISCTNLTAVKRDDILFGLILPMYAP